MNWEMMNNIDRADWMREEPSQKLTKRIRKALKKILDPLGE